MAISPLNSQATEALTTIEHIRESVIGERMPISTPFGNKPLIYADYTASGRSLAAIEDFIQQQVLPFYANTHTETSYTGAQTTALREQARQQIRRSINASQDHQVVFCGSGATAAIHKIIELLNLRLPAKLDQRYQFNQMIAEDERPVVFIGPYEHHSNELPWRESIATVVNVPLNEDGLLDMESLEKLLQQYQDRTLKIGSFSAASNVTGLKTDVDAVTRLLHRYNALSFWDYAAAAPYVSIDMGDTNENIKDAVFISPHKFAGGPGTPGILVVNKKILNNPVPAVVGGGTVVYVTPKDHRYIGDTERREEGGTPGVIESIRAGLVFKLQQTVGTKLIESLEKTFIERAIKQWSQEKNLEILGNSEASRLSIISLRFKHQGKDLHYGFIVALLNDLFGIQARGGCSCAGPYAHHLLGMDLDYSKALENQIVLKQMVMRPGWVRLNFNYFIDEETFDYIVNAIALIAKHGWRLLPFYHFDKKAGMWSYQKSKMELSTQLDDFDITKVQTNKNTLPESREDLSLSTPLALGKRELLKTARSEERYSLTLSDEAERLRWFVLPQEIELNEA